MLSEDDEVAGIALTDAAGLGPIVMGTLPTRLTKYSDA